MKVLVTGGAGYIGGHTALALREAGHEPFVLDDLSGGGEAPAGVELHRGDVTDRALVAQLVERTGAQAILHFAARIQVGESVAEPERYYRTNVGGLLSVVAAAAPARLPVVLSSTAAVYGEPQSVPIPVEHPLAPASPYGWSKRMAEQILSDCADAGEFPFAILRYFNAAGGNVAAGLGERHHPETHLIPLAIDAATGRGPALTIFGADWPTPDGTCVRDYVHVMDLADAHVRALERIRAHGGGCVVNLGAGRGASVAEVLGAVERVTGRPVPQKVAARRSGDVAQLVADIGAARALLGWSPDRSTLDQIVADAVATR